MLLSKVQGPNFWVPIYARMNNVLALQMCGQVTDPDPGTVWKGPGPLILVLHLAGGMELEGVGMCLGWSPS